MRFGWRFVMLFAAGVSPVSYLRYERPLQRADSSGQHYASIDEVIWSHARADLADLRLYSDQREIPFALTVETGGSQAERIPLRILQPSALSGKTQFLLDMGGAAEYDYVLLNVATRDFVAHARVEGQDDLHGKDWAALGVTTVFDLSNEKLGHNTTLHFPLSTYRYLRVTVDGLVKPADLQGASSGTTHAAQAVWRDVGSPVTREEKGKDTLFTFSLPEQIPIERIRFAIDPAQPNFRRALQIEGEKDLPVATGEISRVHMQRSGQKIDLEQTSFDASARGPGKYRVVIHNGDDLPLKITATTLQQYERRIYFDVDAGVRMQLLYGDEKLAAPVYDYRQLFQKEATAKPLSFDAETLNAMFTGRPDQRPWSERHPGILWVAIICAVLVLGGVAVRSLKSASN
jgi:hypothetical protein